MNITLRKNKHLSLAIDFKQAFDLLWQQGLLLKLNRLNCPIPYLLWITNFFKERTMAIDLDGQLSDNIAIARGAPQGSVFGAIAYIVAHYDLQQIFERPENNHLYVDDLASIYIPNIFCEYRNQLIDIEQRINKDLENLRDYTTRWHQPINNKKTQFVVFTNIVKHPKLNIFYDGAPLEQTKVFKYLGYQLDSKLSFKSMVDDQLKKYRQTYSILKHIHRQFPTFFKLKHLFFSTYILPHLYSLSTIYCLLSNTLKERLNSFYRRCLRMKYHLFECPTAKGEMAGLEPSAPQHHLGTISAPSRHHSTILAPSRHHRIFSYQN